MAGSVGAGRPILRATRLGVAGFAIYGKMRSMNLRIAFAAQNMLRNRLDSPAMRPIWCAMQKELVIAERVKEPRIGSIPRPAVNHKITTTLGLPAGEVYNMVEAQMLSNESFKTMLAKCNELISRHPGRWSSAKARIVCGEIVSQASPQVGPVP